MVALKKMKGDTVNKHLIKIFIFIKLKNRNIFSIRIIRFQQLNLVTKILLESLAIVKNIRNEIFRLGIAGNQSNQTLGNS